MTAGEESADRLSWKVRGSARRKEKILPQKVLGSYCRKYQFLTAEIALLEPELKEHMAPHEEKIALLCTIPGVDQVVAWNLIAELGSDMDVFPSAGHCARWAGLTPGENESTGRQQSTRCRKGNKYLRRVLA